MHVFCVSAHSEGQVFFVPCKKSTHPFSWGYIVFKASDFSMLQLEIALYQNLNFEITKRETSVRHNYQMVAQKSSSSDEQNVGFPCLRVCLSFNLSESVPTGNLNWSLAFLNFHAISYGFESTVQLLLSVGGIGTSKFFYLYFRTTSTWKKRQKTKCLIN